MPSISFYQSHFDLFESEAGKLVFLNNIQTEYVDEMTLDLGNGTDFFSLFCNTFLNQCSFHWVAKMIGNFKSGNSILIDPF